MKRIVIAVLVLAGCETNQPADRYGFVAQLGRDTVSVESVTRRGNTLVSDEVDRFPRVRQRHTEIELERLKLRNPHLKLVISIGGWTGSGKFSDAALTDASRRLFTESAIDLFIRQRPGLFDGIDIDWEFPVAGGMKGNVERPADKENFTLLLAELRRQLDAQGAIDRRHYELAIAASAGPRGFANIEIARIVPLLDFINGMTYDYHSGSASTNFNAPLYAAIGDPTPSLNVDATMRRFLDAQVPAGKLLVGIPFYGRGYGSVPSVNGGLFQPGTGSPSGWRARDGD